MANTLERFDLDHVKLGMFAGLDGKDLARISIGARHRRLDSGQPLWFAGEPAAHFAIIEGGVVQIRNVTPTGEGVVVGLFRSGETVGLAAALEHSVFPADAIAIGGHVDVLWMRAAALREALPDSVAVSLAITRELLRHTGALQAKINIVSAGSVPRRLAALMHYLIARFGRETSSGVVAVGLTLSREEISQLVSARVETVIRILSRWQKAGWLRTRADGFEIMRVDMLRRILETSEHEA